ncbi:MAG: twin-arginine translocase TatA/TatE family subunit [Nitrospirae bacterium]|nr:twin-arginine translocase TatA/TatE family subunit [Nitrospirota bacterium]MBF0618430.1 twin-arginine translocase TatA/TatE family subunit [Nitrospirota bacterium]
MFEGLFQPTHLFIIVTILLLLFGPGKLPQIGEGLGKGIRGFKKALSDDSDSNVKPVEQSDVKQ